MKNDGFINNEDPEKKISHHYDAYDRAEKECSLGFIDNTSYYFDPAASVWKIVFQRHGNTPEEDEYQTVYMNMTGKTLLIAFENVVLTTGDNSSSTDTSE